MIWVFKDLTVKILTFQIVKLSDSKIKSTSICKLGDSITF